MKKPSAPTIGMPNSNLYPELPESSGASDQGVQFRLNKISEIRDFLENEVDQRDKLIIIIIIFIRITCKYMSQVNLTFILTIIKNRNHQQ